MIETEHLPVTKRSPYRSVSDKKDSQVWYWHEFPGYETALKSIPAQLSFSPEKKVEEEIGAHHLRHFRRHKLVATLLALDVVNMFVCITPKMYEPEQKHTFRSAWADS